MQCHVVQNKCSLVSNSFLLLLARPLLLVAMHLFLVADICTRYGDVIGERGRQFGIKSFRPFVTCHVVCFGHPVTLTEDMLQELGDV